MTIDEFMRKLVARAETIVFPKTPKTINNIPVFYFEAVLSALRGPQPDPLTGLVPCGCGGVPVPYSWDETLFYGDTPCLDVTVACQKCGMGGNIWHESKLDAKNWWNTAMSGGMYEQE